MARKYIMKINAPLDKSQTRFRMAVRKVAYDNKEPEFVELFRSPDVSFDYDANHPNKFTGNLTGGQSNRQFHADLGIGKNVTDSNLRFDYIQNFNSDQFPQQVTVTGSNSDSYNGNYQIDNTNTTHIESLRYDNEFTPLYKNNTNYMFRRKDNGKWIIASDVSGDFTIYLGTSQTLPNEGTWTSPAGLDPITVSFEINPVDATIPNDEPNGRTTCIKTAVVRTTIPQISLNPNSTTYGSYDNPYTQAGLPEELVVIFTYYVHEQSDLVGRYWHIGAANAPDDEDDPRAQIDPDDIYTRKGHKIVGGKWVTAKLYTGMGLGGTTRSITNKRFITVLDTETIDFNTTRANYPKIVPTNYNAWYLSDFRLGKLRNREQVFDYLGPTHINYRSS